MADKETELPEDVQQIKNIVDKVYSSEEYEARRKKMRKFMDLYKGELYDDTLAPEESMIQINYPFSNVETLTPLLTDNRPVWHYRARLPMYQNISNLFKLGLDYLWDETKMGSTVIPDAEKRALIYDNGIVKVSYDPDEEDVSTESIDPATFVCAPGYDDNWDAPWQGEVKRKPLTWIAGNFPDKLDEITPDGDERDDTKTTNSKKSFFKQVHESCVIYELWIKDSSVEDYFDKVTNEDGSESREKKQRAKYPNGRLLMFTNTCVLRDGPTPFKFGTPPYVFFYDYKIPGEMWGMGEIEQIEHLHKEINLQLQAVVKNSRISHNKNYLYDEAANLPDSIVKDFWQGGNIWPASFINTEKPVQGIDPGPIDQSVLTLLSILPNAIEEVSQVGELMKGQSTKNERQSATEMSVLAESSYTRVRQKVRNLEESIRRTASLCVQIMQEFWVAERYVSVKSADDKGQRLDYMQVGSNKRILEQSNKPVRGEDEADEEYAERQKNDPVYQKTLKVIEKIGDDESINWKGAVEIQTNSTLPTDQQTLANLYLRLAQITVTPDSIVDDKAVLDGLDIPDGDAIIARKQADRQKMAAAQQPQGPQRRAGPRPPQMGREAMNQGGPTI